MSETPRGTVIFDLDGTLVDSAPDLADTLDEVLADRGLAPIGLDGTRALIGHGIPALVRSALVLRQGPVTEDDLARASDRFLSIYSGRLAAKTRPYPGAPEVLDALAGAGWRLTVCTNKREAAASEVLRELGLLRFFAQVAGPDTFEAAKPDPAHLLGLLPCPQPAVVVGDSEIDVAAARAAGLPVVAVAWGYARRPVGDLGADAIAFRFEQVPGLVEGLSPRPRHR
ncbi:HAD-IA family hydrolase [Rubellimicrobium aerolatum]|uniref:Phosphoglycolate phosphatase n=1 Tax=Rubellimicrobium aerolatum TaxID=490979 RepID=A0ABW0SHY4_9RHOB|nr:HAD-IA family hydrolase [Rubellimicrobium aerolatum]MBP1807549.1 phosphoglycolate phosphatase [Rubellimicrobium aerolatum]